ncbi:MAG: hypothetical protein K0U86_17685 [Planctomycetes bacterium]|nr:hypothetical protein [Planctomycetota bacterium]MCH9726738.1 hypothetical protein [Planctomycetota bacterium]MCH9779646.1 hypothetical protein [Planctomycetota bacterium]MCH9789262.1 hypothetical protein [Planctomycetota bacterium]MDF1744104.1 hypothetical protein [Gimesia sp.]
MIAFGLPGFFELLIVGVMMIGIGVFPFWMICSKAGFPGWISLAVLIPVLNVALLFFLAFAEWPALKNSPQQDRREE